MASAPLGKEMAGPSGRGYYAALGLKFGAELKGTPQHSPVGLWPARGSEQHSRPVRQSCAAARRAC